MSDTFEQHTFLDGVDVLKNYDQAMMDLVQIPLDVDYRYTSFELSQKSVEELQQIAVSRGSFSNTENAELLKKSILNTQRIPIIFSTPENAWGDPEFVTGIEDTNKLGANLFYPAVTVWRDPPIGDPDRYSTPLRRKIMWNSDKNQVLQSKQPLPFNITYHIDTYALNMKHMNLMSLHYVRLFGVYPATIKVDVGKPWGVIPIYQTTVRITDNSELENFDGSHAEKILRKTYDVQVWAWFPQESWFTKTVRKTQVEIVDDTLPIKKPSLEKFPPVTLPDPYVNEE